MDIWLRDVLERYRGASQVGETLYKLAFAYITSFIFYFLVVHVKTQNDKLNLNRYTVRYVNAIIRHAEFVLSSMIESSKIKPQNKYPTLQEMLEITKAIGTETKPPNSFVGHSGSFKIWHKYLGYHMSSTLTAIKLLYRQLPFLDSKLIDLIIRVEDCRYFFVLENLVESDPPRGFDMTILHRDLYVYLAAVEDLEDYNARKLDWYIDFYEGKRPREYGTRVPAARKPKNKK